MLGNHGNSFWDTLSHTLMVRHSSQTATSMVSWMQASLLTSMIHSPTVVLLVRSCLKWKATQVSPSKYLYRTGGTRIIHGTRLWKIQGRPMTYDVIHPHSMSDFTPMMAYFTMFVLISHHILYANILAYTDYPTISRFNQFMFLVWMIQFDLLSSPAWLWWKNLYIWSNLFSDLFPPSSHPKRWWNARESPFFMAETFRLRIYNRVIAHMYNDVYLQMNIDKLLTEWKSPPCWQLVGKRTLLLLTNTHWTWSLKLGTNGFCGVWSKVGQSGPLWTTIVWLYIDNICIYIYYLYIYIVM